MGWIFKAKKVVSAIKKYGPKAIAAIKKGARSVYDSFMAAKAKGWVHLTWWLVKNTSALGAIYDALKSAGLI
ncbi:hypothetical protein [Salinithrix halophila]|uniref:Aureocin-like type II bacteriocin n=1 Tax=Salinithrix halophila TaxID=1485204 RepID=A0ABV8JGK0_9BACL